MIEKHDLVNVNPESYPGITHLGRVVSKRKSKWGWMTYKVKYDCFGMMLTETFSEKEVTPYQA